MKRDTVILETPRLYLRYQDHRDIKFLMSLWSDPDTTRFVGGPREGEFLRREFTKTADHPRDEEYDLWPLIRTVDHRILGHAGLLPKTVDSRSYLEVSFFLAPEYRGQGYALEIARGLITLALNELHEPAVIAIIHPGNTSSRRVVTRAGMEFWRQESRSGTPKDVYRILGPRAR